MPIVEDKSSIEWIHIKEYCEGRLAALRIENDDNLDPIETSLVRGKISMCLEVLGLDKAEQKIDVPDTEYLP